MFLWELQEVSKAELCLSFFLFWGCLSANITRLAAEGRFAVGSVSHQSEEKACMLAEECLETRVRVWKEHSGIFDVKWTYRHVQSVRYCVVRGWLLVRFVEPTHCWSFLSHLSAPSPEYSNEYGCLLCGKSAQCSSPSRGRRQGEAAGSAIPLAE